MKTVKLILNQFRYDFARLGWIMALWAAWVLLDGIIGWQRWHGSFGGNHHHVLAYFSTMIVPLIGIVLIAVLAPTLAVSHSLWRSDAFWRTRPIPVGHLFLTRILFLIAFVGLIPFTIRFVILTASGFEPMLAFVNAAGFSLVFLAGAFALWGFSILFTRSRILVVASSAIIFSLYILSISLVPELWWYFSRPPAGFEYPVQMAIPNGLHESGFLISLILLIVGGGLTGLILFQWRRRTAGIFTMTLSLIFASATPLWWRKNFFKETLPGSVRSSVQLDVKVPPGDGNLVKGSLSWNSETFPNQNWLGLVDFATVYPLATGPYSIPGRKVISPPAGNSESIRSALENYSAPLIGGPAMTGGWWRETGTRRNRNLDEGSGARVLFPAISPWWLRPRPWQVTGEIQAHWFSHEVAGAIPLQPGSRFVKNGLVISLVSARLIPDTTPNRESLAIVLIADRPTCIFTGNEYWRSKELNDPFEQWHLAVEIPTGDNAEPEKTVSHHLGRVASAGLPENRAEYRFPVYHHSQPDQTPLIPAESLKKCRLIVLRPVYRETTFVPFEGGAPR